MVAPLTDLTSPAGAATADIGTPAAAVAAAMGPAPVEYSYTNVPLPLDAILAAEHAVNVHESAENIQNYIACGEIGGVVVDDDGDTLVVALRPLNDSGYFGLAFLTADGDNTNVKVWLAEPAAAPGVEATPVN